MAVQKELVYSVFDEKGAIFDKYCLNLKILENSGNYLIHKNTLKYRILKKQGTVSTKTKSEVRGGGRKPWKQKGTGNARAGSNRSPLWRGGGVIFGPKPKKIKFKVNKKECKLAFRTLLFNKYKSTILINNFIENWAICKTRNLLNFLTQFNIKLSQKILLVVSIKTKPLFLASRNNKNIKLISAKTLNTTTLLQNKVILITQSALNDIIKIYNN